MLGTMFLSFLGLYKKLCTNWRLEIGSSSQHFQCIVLTHIIAVPFPFCCCTSLLVHLSCFNILYSLPSSLLGCKGNPYKTEDTFWAPLHNKSVLFMSCLFSRSLGSACCSIHFLFGTCLCQLITFFSYSFWLANHLV